MARLILPPSTVLPIADSLAGAIGSPGTLARGDHEHPVSAIYVPATQVAPAGTIEAGKLLEFVSSGVYPAGDGSALTNVRNMVEIADESPSGTPTTVTLTGLSDTYRTYMVLIERIKPVVDSNIFLMRVGTPSIQSGPSDYGWRLNSDSSSTGQQSVSDSVIRLSHSNADIGGAAGESVGAVLWLQRALDAESSHFHVWGNVIVDIDVGPQPSSTRPAGRFQTPSANIDRVQFLWNSGDFADQGRLRLFGIAG